MSEQRILNDIEQHILDAIQRIKFGALEIVIHDSRVVQIEQCEKTRFDNKRHVTPTL